MSRGPSPTARELGRVCAAALLLAGGAAGVRALAGLWTSPSADRPPGASLAAFAVLEAVALGLAVAALRRRRAGPRRFGRWTRPLAAGFVVLVLGSPLAMLLVAAVKVAGSAESAPLPTPSSGPSGAPPSETDPTMLPSLPPPPWHDESPGSDTWTLIPLVLLLLVAAVAAWLVVRRRPWAGPPGPDVPVPPPPAGFQEAAEAGGRALRTTGDPRGAVIACYTAMEDVLTEAGAGPRRSDTPAEVLARASGAGLEGLDAAATLTRLFREARYSAHPVTERHRAEALAALESLRAGSRV
ncbi:DUF4129 domain-containing protein [Actinomadura darangshiensis]|uniref:DUF4129 domain-containing protein n=1 Tax=Actinomadura darangshiensis TaxID=705336 RepID=A0A4R5BLN7_9ACTN|nr:DUF4129 domain-containing protein [Actinomadura darangshiensis]TDD86196.1 DUF4129 domain-containing protein [Actinomadura darangshiensis]